ncbi:hypothetical protein EUGRSUZ_C02599 [Eucalyptus grandis]|uniref:Uncharacterized protein n=2 Tax=Eucalyptus grandis TaxID=71139 RepID=A0ACC3LG30_EUCGR|nr:hypothetical protein EUGRSUZ_C02599 [Eucalyptus grandis]
MPRNVLNLRPTTTTAATGTTTMQLLSDLTSTHPHHDSPTATHADLPGFCWRSVRRLSAKRKEAMTRCGKVTGIENRPYLGGAAGAGTQPWRGSSSVCLIKGESEPPSSTILPLFFFLLFFSSVLVFPIC